MVLDFTHTSQLTLLHSKDIMGLEHTATDLYHLFWSKLILSDVQYLAQLGFSGSFSGTVVWLYVTDLDVRCFL